MSVEELSKSYDPSVVERVWYDFWLEKGFFHADADAGGVPYCIVIPPPNVTGSLHVGHAYDSTLQDILVRWMRMSGRNTLWLPGTDHAGIATQNVVERQLAQKKIDRHSLGREQFIQEVWKWKHEYGGRIIGQLKHIGASCDWDRERFTMDEGLSRAVREVFVRLHEEGLIYRGERLINWCPRCHTALSDIEVEHEDEKGKLYHIAYPLSHDKKIRLTVATTRPETMLGDTAVAVHPLDPRYKELIGKTIDLPLTTRTIPIVGDAILVDLEFGSGAVKVTPAHDFNDYEAGLRQDPPLPRIKMLSDKAEILPDIPDVLPATLKHVAGKPAKKARGIVVQLLQEQGFLVKTDDYGHAIGKCYRCKSVVEPALSPQWFVKTGPLAGPAIEAVETGKITFHPKGWENTYFDWMRNIKDWCISRQIWWGTPDTGLVLRRLRRDYGQPDRPHCLRRVQEHEPPPGDGCPRHMVLVGPVALLDTGLARQDTGALVLLPHIGSRHRPRHYLFLGGADDHDGSPFHEGCALQGRVYPCPRPGRRRTQDE